MSTDPETIAYYQANAPVYRASTALGISRHLDAFLDRLEPDASILELGCGGGRDAAHIDGRGFAIDPTDGVEAMVRKARERTGLPVRTMRFDQLEAVAQYDAVWAHACLLHATRAALPDILRSIHRALKPRAWHFANFKLGDADHPAEGRDLLGRWTNLPDPEWLEDVYRDAGFEIVETVRYRGNGCDGTQRDWYALTVRIPA